MIGLIKVVLMSAIGLIALVSFIETWRVML